MTIKVSHRDGGVSRYHSILYSKLPDYNINVTIPSIYTENTYLETLGVKHRTLPRYLNCKYNPYIIAWLNQQICRQAIRQSNYDIYHPTFVNPYYDNMLQRGKPVVVTVHDLIQEKSGRADAKKTSARRSRQLDRADAIICVSQQTKDDLLILYPQVRGRKIEVIYHGNDQNIPTKFGQRLFEWPYVLYVGGREEYKNFDNMLRAMTMLPAELHLVCTGSGFSPNEMELIGRLDLNNRVHQTFVSDSQLSDLYHYAEVFIYPSTMEGFGIPILEAFRNGCPIAVSDIKCFHEVAGDGTQYFNPAEPHDIAHTLKTIIADSDHVKELKEYGYNRLKQFSWGETIRKHAELYHGLI